jgi:hypothetical protein
MIKLFHDDVRPPYDGWKLARNNQEAKEILSTGKVIVCSLDRNASASPRLQPWIERADAEAAL